MNLSRRIIISCSLVGICLAIVAMARQLPRELEQSALRTVAGGAGGGVTACDAANRTTDTGYKCGTDRSFACTNQCNECESKTSQQQCMNAICWKCDNGVGITAITECIYDGKQMTCNIFGGVAVCGVWRRSNCSWNGTSCTCPEQYTNSGACPRKDCS